MDTSVISMDDMNYLAQQSAGNLNMILSGMTAIMADNDSKVAMLENQTWYQRMSRTILGKNKMTQQEIQQNHDRINMYMSQAMTELFNQNCIDHQAILSLGNRLNEIYADHIQLKQMLGAFVSKLNEKIESIDNFHMLTTEINQHVYSNYIPIIAISKIMSQIDVRTAKDSRKMDILVRAMKDAGIVSTEEVYLSKLLCDLLDISESEAGIFSLFYSNLRNEYISEIIADTLLEYYLLPQNVRKMKNRQAFVEKILSDRQIDLIYMISLEELYLSIVEAYENTRIQDVTMVEENINNTALREVEEAILNYQLELAYEKLEMLDREDDTGRVDYLKSLCWSYGERKDEELQENFLFEGYQKKNPLAAIRYAREFEMDLNKEQKIYSEYMSQIRVMAEKEDIFAEYEYGELLLQDNIGEGGEWIKKSSKSGFWPATLRLGECYEDGEGIEINERKAFKCYKKVYKLGVPEAMELLADCYYYGAGTSEDQEKAMDLYLEYVSLYIEADSSGNINDMMERGEEMLLAVPDMKFVGYNLAMCFFAEDGGEFLGLGYLKASADLNNPFACYELAKYYYNTDYDEDEDRFNGVWLEDASEYLEKADQYADEDAVDLQYNITKLSLEITKAMISSCLS